MKNNFLTDLVNYCNNENITILSYDMEKQEAIFRARVNTYSSIDKITEDQFYKNGGKIWLN